MLTDDTSHFPDLCHKSGKTNQPKSSFSDSSDNSKGLLPNIEKSLDSQCDQFIQPSASPQKEVVRPLLPQNTTLEHQNSAQVDAQPLSYVQEWRDSCVSDAIIAANVAWLEDDDAVDMLTRPAIENMGGHSAQYPTTAVINLRQRYDHVKAGGWAAQGLDPLNHWQRMDWGQFKPVTPRTAWKNPDKIIKYEGPAGVPTRAFFGEISGDEVQAYCDRNRLDGQKALAEIDQCQQELAISSRPIEMTALAAPGDTPDEPADSPVLSYPGYWEWIKRQPALPILIGEGVKKAGAALTVGYATIALPGIYSGYRSKDALGNPVKPHLIADIEALAQAGRTIYLAFDQDEKPETRRHVGIALSRFGQLLKDQGCHVKVVQWHSSKGKGIDDLIAAHGPDAFHQAVEQALIFEEWQLWQALENRLTLAPSIRLKVNDLTALSPESIPNTGVIGIASGKGTGKTKFISELLAEQDKALLAGHRISLMRNLSERFDINYRGDLDKHLGRFFDGDAYTLRVSTVVDSLLAINPADFTGCDLILDEVCQVLRHLLTSSTCNKDGKRPALLMRFRELVRAARRVIIADADLDDNAIRYIQDLRGDEGKPFLVRNDYQAPGYPVRFIESPDDSAIIGELLNDLRAGLRLYIATDSKQGSKRIHRLITELRSQLGQPGEDLLINSETSGGELEQAFMKTPDRYLTAFSIQTTTASPSAGTGISVEGDHFDKVYGIFYGSSSTDADMAQSLLRVRATVPRVVWCAKYGRNFSKVGRETSPLKLRNLLQQKTTANTLLIRASLSELSNQALSTYDWANDPHISYWAEIETERNRSMWNLRAALKVRLMYEGHQVKRVSLSNNNQAQTLLKAAREELKIEHALKVEIADNLNPLEAKQLEQLDGLDEAQRLALQKWHLAEFYCVPVTEVDADLVLWDNSGRRRGQLLNLEGFLSPEVTTAADVRSLEKQSQWQQGFTPWDIGKASLKRWMREQLGLEVYLQPNQHWDSESLADFKALTLGLVPQIKAALNFTVTEKMSAVQILNQLLEQMGVVCVGKQARVGGGDRIRIYQLEPCSWQLNTAVLERRKARRQHLSESVTAPLLIDQLEMGCDTHKAPAIEMMEAWPSVLILWLVESVMAVLIQGLRGALSRRQLPLWRDVS